MSIKKITILVFLFATAMGFMESAVVIYLREIYYPDGFRFPMKVIPVNIASVEILREFATLIMLIMTGWIAGKNKIQRFCFFLFSFGVWDIFYYVFLKIFLDWPESLFTWDILFLIPVPWLGPVLAPCILSVTMIFITLLMVYYDSKKIILRYSTLQWAILIAGSLIIIASFTEDYMRLIFKSANTATDALSAMVNYVPAKFDWPLFGLGEILILFTVLKAKRNTIT